MPEREKTLSLYDSIFGAGKAPQMEAETERNLRFQDMLDRHRQAITQQRTDDVRMAQFNALGNVLTTMVQPLGWAAGGTTAGVQPYDNRQYLDAFNRAVKANADLRNVGNMEAEYNFKLADENFRRAQALEDEARRMKLQDAREAATFQRRLDLFNAQNEGRIELEHIKGKYRLSAKNTGKSPSEDFTSTFLKRAATAYNNYKADYMKKQAVGIVMAHPLMSWESFLGDFAGKEGYNVNPQTQATDTANRASTTTTSSGSPASTTSNSSKVPPTRRNTGSGNSGGSKRPPSKRADNSGDPVR